MITERFWSDAGVLSREIVDGEEVTSNLGKTREQLGILPGFTIMLGNAAKSSAIAVSKPQKVSDEERARRLQICRSCEFMTIKYNKERCLKCGCFLKWKTLLEAWHCPIHKW